MLRIVVVVQKVGQRLYSNRLRSDGAIETGMLFGRRKKRIESNRITALRESFVLDGTYFQVVDRTVFKQRAMIHSGLNPG